MVDHICEDGAPVRFILILNFEFSDQSESLLGSAVRGGRHGDREAHREIRRTQADAGKRGQEASSSARRQHLCGMLRKDWG